MVFTQEDKIQILQDVIRIKSENDHELEVAEYYKDLLNKYGIDSQLVEYAPGRSSLVADVKGSQGEGKLLVISGHLDVVAAGPEEDWTYPPFAAEIHDGKMYGRGTTDMKAGLTALILAMIELKEAGAPFAGTLRLAATVGEEIGMYGSRQLVDEGYVDGADGFLIAEPSSQAQIINSHKGSIQYEVHAYGRAAHSSTPELGVDALQLLVDYINESNAKFAEAFDGIVNDQLGKTLNVNTVINGGTQINSVAGHAVLKANARTVPEADGDVVIQIIKDVIEKLNKEDRGTLELNILQNNPSAISDVDNALTKAIHAAKAEEIPVIALAGATDASNFGRIANKYDLAIYGPGDSSLAHIVDEYVEVDDYLQFIDIYKKTIKEYLA